MGNSTNASASHQESHMKLRSPQRVLSRAVAVAMGSMLVTAAIGQDVEVIPVFPIASPDDARSHGLESLSTLVEREGVPLPSGLSRYIKDYTAARQLGKALFHEQAVGSDGVQACVTCHFKAGADPRIKNQISPGLLVRAGEREGDVIGYFNAWADPDTTFQIGGPNYTLKRDDFPFIRDIGSGGKNALSNHDAATSQGVFFTYYEGVQPGGLVDYGTPIPDIFNVNSLNTRRDEPRNTPTMINAVFNFANFWAGRANNRFNGQNPFGEQDLNAVIYEGKNGTIVAHDVDLKNASLASQAVGPPGSHFEMSYGNGSDNGRPMADIARKLMSRYILSEQDVDKNDSLLGSLVNRSTGKIEMTYGELIDRAFKPQFTNADVCVVAGADKNGGLNGKVDGEPVATDYCNEGNYSIKEANFAFIYGVSVMLYEATLVSDKTPFDNWMSSGYDSNFGDAELSGLNVFVGKGKCINCHGGPELTNASVRNAQNGRNVIEPMVMGDRQAGIYDNGYYNIGVTPTLEDRGRGDADPWGKPLSWTRQFAFEALGIQDIPFPIIGAPIDHLSCAPTDSNRDADPLTCDDGILGFTDPQHGFFEVCRDLDGDSKCGTTDDLILRRVAVDGAFKTPGLRNVAETAPYFHNGSKATLREVVQFYDRGGDFCRNNFPDLDPDIQPIGFSDQEEKDLVAFLISLTDPRVVKRSAPFDSPSYAIPMGHPGDESYVEADPWIYGQAKDDLMTVPAVGKNGGKPLQPFLGIDDSGQFYANKVNGICSPFDNGGNNNGGTKPPKGGKGQGKP